MSSERSRASTRRGSDLVAFQPRKRRSVDADRHRERRLVDRDHGKRTRVVRVGERLADRHLGDSGDGDDLPRSGFFRLDTVERLGHIELGHLRPLDRAVGAAPRDLLGTPDRPLKDAAEREPADVRRGIEVRDERLQRVPLVVGRSRDALEDQVEQRLEILLERRPGRARATRAPPSHCSRRSETRSGSRPRPGRGRARRPRRRRP